MSVEQKPCWHWPSDRQSHAADNLAVCSLKPPLWNQTLGINKSNGRAVYGQLIWPPVKCPPQCEEFLTLWRRASPREQLTSEMNSQLCFGGCWPAGLLTPLTNSMVCLENFWPGRIKERRRRGLRAKLIAYAGGGGSINIIIALYKRSDNLNFI